MFKTMSFVFRIIQNATADVLEACKGNDLIIVSHSRMGATEAEYLGTPTVNVTLQKEMIAEKLKPQTFKSRLIGSLIGKQMAKPYNKIRKVYGMKPLKSSDEIISRRLNLVPISKHVLPRNPYWENHHVMTGDWYKEALDQGFLNFFQKQQNFLLTKGKQGDIISKLSLRKGRKCSSTLTTEQ